MGTAAGTAGNRAVKGRSHRRRYVCPPVRDSRTRGRPANNGASTAHAWAGSGTGERRVAGVDRDGVARGGAHRSGGRRLLAVERDGRRRPKPAESTEGRCRPGGAITGTVLLVGSRSPAPFSHRPK